MKKTTAVLGLLVAVMFASFVSAKPVDQPRMQAAKSDLLSARAQLMQADHNKGGHRTKAINFINQAVAAINRGIAFDRRNNHASADHPTSSCLLAATMTASSQETVHNRDPNFRGYVHA